LFHPDFDAAANRIKAKNMKQDYKIQKIYAVKKITTNAKQQK